MGLLDDLHTQVEKIRDEEARKNAELKAQEAFYELRLKHVMQRAHKYLEEVVESLNIIAPDIYVSYPLDPSRPKGVSLRQADYFFNSDNSRHPRQIDILAHCSLTEPVEFYVPTNDAASKQTEYLQSCQFPHDRRNKLDKLYNVCGATFTLEGPMKVHIRLLANPAEKCVNIHLRNLESEPVKKYKIAPEKVNEELLERLARLLIRDETHLVEVQIDEDFRSELRRKIEEDNLAKERDLAQAYAEIEADRLREKEAKKLMNRARRTVSRGKHEFLKLVSKAQALARIDKK
jgi:hypothetical protein